MDENHEVGSYGGAKLSEKTPQSCSNEMVAVNQDAVEMEDDSSGKHSKMPHLQSVLQPEGNDTHDSGTPRMEEIEDHIDIVGTQGSQVIDKNAAENVDTNKPPTFSFHQTGSKPVDPNSEMFTDENSGYDDNVVSLGDDGKHSSGVKEKAAYEHKHTYLSASLVDPKTEDVSSSAIQDPCYRYTSHSDHLKMRNSLECKEEKDALRKWKEMKQNGFISPSYGGIPPPLPAAAPPKQRGRKRKGDVLKQKMEQAKKEQVDKFTKIAAPSGLLNGLNPGIINHVRNSKQVHSILQALVKSENQEGCKQLRQTSNTEKENPNVSQAVASLSSMPQSKLICENHLSYDRSFSLLGSQNRSGFRELATEEGRFCAEAYFAPTHSRTEIGDDRFAFKPTSSNIDQESNSCLSNNESANFESADTLSVKGGTVASQWLHLLHQDIKGRLAAIHRSKKRVHAVITTELPFLLIKEFSPNQENDPYNTAELHKAKWSKLFHQMDATLSEEEKLLEEWLDQVNTMLLRCDEGLQHVQLNALFEMQQLGTFDQFRIRIKDPSKDLEVKAAAASIYSMSNILSSRENVSCC